jgi:14-3-3 protein epsilon
MGKLDNLSNLSKDELILLSKMAEQSERYEEMIEFVRHFISKISSEPSVEERNILSVAFKNVVGNRRTAWRVLNSIEQKESRRGNEDNKSRASTYKEKVEAELRSYCREILRTIDDSLIPNTSSDEGKVFFIKMKGDYFRYICEFAQGAYRDESAKNAQESYQSALTLAENTLDSTHPSRIGLALNYSVFNYEILNQQEEAIKIAQKAFDEGISNLENLSDEQAYKESTMILQLIRDNISLWTSESADN